MSGKRFEGKNLEEALDAAARAFGVESFRISYHVVLEKRGFLGGTKRVVIEAEVSDRGVPARHEEGKPKGEARRPESRDRERGERNGKGNRRPRTGRGRSEEGAPSGKGRGRRQREGRPEADQKGSAPAAVVEIPEQGEQSADAARVAEWCERIFALSELDVVVRTTDRGEEILVELFGPDLSKLEDSGDYLDSLQVLANKAFTGRHFERRIELDAAGFKERRAQELAERAREMAERVREEGRERTMRAMSPIERRIVHVTLESEPGVRTESRGRGFHKRVAILPAEDEEPSAASES